jgi:uncharacterized membrane protein YedE/YeeE
MHSLVIAALGGVLIGASAGALWLFGGRIAGVSGILTGALDSDTSERGWRWCFLSGMGAVGLVGSNLFPAAVGAPVLGGAGLLLAGVLIGVGTQLSGGCTSGHGVCGLGRGSARSLVATLTFMMVAALTVLGVRHLGIKL